MSDAQLKRRLLDLAVSAQRSSFQRIVDVFAEIDAAMDAGATRAQIVEALNAEGIDVAPKVFTNYMLRIREMRAREGVAPTPPGGLPPSEDGELGASEPFEGDQDDRAAPAPRRAVRSGRSK